MNDRDLRLTRWIIDQLRYLHSNEANVAILRYAKEIDARFPNTPASVSVPGAAKLRGLAGEIRIIMSFPAPPQ